MTEPINQRENNPDRFWETLGLLYRFHPWHGLKVHPEFPEKTTVYVEIVPSDTMKFEVDKVSGILKIDRPQRFSNRCPAPYGFIPRTFCGKRNADVCMRHTGKRKIAGDGDPLDVCVLCESDINHGDILLTARPIGGLRMIDGNEADDKILAVLEGDLAFENVADIRDLPAKLIDRLRHYFLTYKEIPGEKTPKIEITEIYGREGAIEVMLSCRDDYEEKYGALKDFRDQAVEKR